jgi:hypothetical protein
MTFIAQILVVIAADPTPEVTAAAVPDLPDNVLPFRSRSARPVLRLCTSDDLPSAS